MLTTQAEMYATRVVWVREHEEGAVRCISGLIKSKNPDFYECQLGNGPPSRGGWGGPAPAPMTPRRFCTWLSCLRT